jgi:glyoxylase-like metal-dependent hydrolase (beta-lactamase superfamily II)
MAHRRAGVAGGPSDGTGGRRPRESLRSEIMTSVHLIHPGYVREGSHVGSSVTFVRDGDALIVADPGLVANRGLILDPLAALGVAPEAVTHVLLSHHHPDHTVNIALFPNAEIVDFWARYRDDLWLDHGRDGWQMTPGTQLWLTPGHSEEDASLIIEAEDGVYALTHLWWFPDRTPEIDPYSPDQALLDFHRARVLEVADIIIPGHGEAFRTAG